MNSLKFRLVIDDPGPTPYLNRATRDIVEKASDVSGHFAELLSHEMRFSYEAIRHDIGGVLQADGNWTGVIGMLNRSEVDISVAPLFISEERSQAVTYSYPFTISDVTFVTKKGEYKGNVFATFLVFNKSVWMAICLAVFLVALLYYVFQRKKYSFSSVVFNILGISLLQSGGMKPQKAAGFLLLCSWIIATAFLAMSYTSVLLSYLSVPILKGVRSIPQLAEAVQKNGYMCMTLQGTSIPFTLSLSKNKAMRLVGENIEKNPNGYGHIGDFVRHSRENIAYIQPREEISFLGGKFFVSEDGFFLTMGAIAATKNFCCKDKLNRAILAITESGLYEKLLHDYNFVVALNEFSSMPATADYPRKLSLLELPGAFIVLITGYILSILALCFELWLYKKIT